MKLLSKTKRLNPPSVSLSHLLSLTVLSSAMLSSSVWAKTETLTVYTYDSFTSEWGPGPAMKKGFESQCGCELKFVPLEDGVSILNRLRLEGSHSKADVVLGLDNNLITEAQKTGLFTSSNVDVTKLQVPNGWTNTTFVPYDYGYFAFVYNKKKLTNPPHSLREMVDKSNDLTIIYQDPRTSTPGQGLLLWVKSVYGDKAPQAWQRLAKKTVTVTKGWSEAYSMFLKGESDMVLSYTTSPAYHVIAENNHDYATADFAEGNYLQVEVAAKVKGSPHSQLADQFLSYMVSHSFQKEIPTTNWMYPVVATQLPQGFQQLDKPKHALEFSPEQVAAHRKAWIREWQHAVAF